MNPIAITHGILALIIIAISLPLIRRKIGRNSWYGIRIPEAFKSEERWLEINHYGGRLLLAWGVAIAIVSGLGLPLEKKYWPAYGVGLILVLLGGLGIVVALILRYAAKTKKN